MASWEDVRRIALALPETSEKGSYGNTGWRVKDKGFVWERPLRRGDVEALGADAPDGPILGVRVADVGVKEALIADDPALFFTIPHFDGYPAVLVRLDRIDVDELSELIVDAWLLRAPKRLARAVPGRHPARVVGAPPRPGRQRHRSPPRNGHRCRSPGEAPPARDHCADRRDHFPAAVLHRRCPARPSAPNARANDPGQQRE